VSKQALRNALLEAIAEADALAADSCGSSAGEYFAEKAQRWRKALLSPRHWLTMKLLAEGKSVEEIGRLLQLTSGRIYQMRKEAELVLKQASSPAAT
jgi:DNA-binding NarL/FixJ family response regulator